MKKSSIDDILHDPNVQILPPDYSLKKKIGEDVNIRDILTPEVVQKSQELIDSQQGDFIEWAFKDLVTLTHAFNALKKSPYADGHFKKLLNVAFSLKCQAGTFGFSLASNVAKSLYDYCNRITSIDEGAFVVLGKHVESLTVIFQQNIKGDGGDIGKELMGTLAMLINKYERK